MDLINFCAEYINADDIIGYCLDLMNKMRRNLINLRWNTLSITGLTGLSMMPCPIIITIAYDVIGINVSTQKLIKSTKTVNSVCPIILEFKHLASGC